MNYRFYLLDGSYHFGAAESVCAPDDDTAHEIGAAVFDGCSDVFQGHELWRAAELLARVRKRGAPSGEIRPSDMMVKQQESVLELEERVQATFSCLKTSRRLLEMTAAIRERAAQPATEGGEQ